MLSTITNHNFKNLSAILLEIWLRVELLLTTSFLPKSCTRAGDTLQPWMLAAFSISTISIEFPCCLSTGNKVCLQIGQFCSPIGQLTGCIPIGKTKGLRSKHRLQFMSSAPE